MDRLIVQKSPIVVFATNTFINVPVILRVGDTDLVQVVKVEQLGFTTQIPIYHPDGTKLAVVTGNRPYTTIEGKKDGVTVDNSEKGLWVCKRGKETLFELKAQTGDAFKVTAELYTPEGYFVKSSDQIPLDFQDPNTPFKFGGLTFKNNVLSGMKIGIWLKKDGIAIGSNG